MDEAESAGPGDSVGVGVLVVVFVLTLVVAGATAFVLTRGPEPVPDTSAAAGTAAAVGTTATDHPARWDPRVRRLVRVTERLRGLEFKHPVAVRFRDGRAFERGLTSGRRPTRSDRVEIEQYTGLLRALGLLTGDVDLEQSFRHGRASGALAYYSFEDQRVTVRGNELTPAVRATVVHELTHVLQDQHFAIGRRVRTLARSEDPEDVTERSVLSAVVEGDASRSEVLYRATLSHAGRRALDADAAAQHDSARRRIGEVPAVVSTMIGAPYVLGQALAEAVGEHGGNAAVDGLFTDTPAEESALLDPFELLAGETRAVPLAVPGLYDGEQEVGSGRLGAVTWYLVLAQRLPLGDALAAVDGWNGDSYVAFERDGTTCVHASYAGDRPPDTARMLRLLRRWVAAGPASTASVRRDGAAIRFESCDPGTAAVAGDAPADALALPTTRTYLGIQAMRAGMSRAGSRCYAGELVRAFPVSSLRDPTFGSDPRTVRRAQRLALGCV